MYISVVGVSFQIALISDALNLLTIHAQCFYGYARAIYKIEMDSLKSLFRLFRGKKFNPMRKRIDSYLYNIDQLFIGTLGFCIAFFLLPTVLIYYVVFLSVSDFYCNNYQKYYFDFFFFYLSFRFLL
jgi:phosphatidylinositol glycan class Q protein